MGPAAQGTRSRSRPWEGARPEPAVRSRECRSFSAPGEDRGGIPETAPVPSTQRPAGCQKRALLHVAPAAFRGRETEAQHAAAPHVHSPGPGPRAPPSGRGDRRAARRRRGSLRAQPTPPWVPQRRKGGPLAGVPPIVQTRCGELTIRGHRPATSQTYAHPRHRKPRPCHCEPVTPPSCGTALWVM